MLRKISALGGALVLALGASTVLPGVTGMQVGSLGGITHAYADSGEQAFCAQNGSYFLTNGACISYFASNGTSSAAASAICKPLTYPFTFPDNNGNLVTLDNRGQCVSYLNHLS